MTRKLYRPPRGWEFVRNSFMVKKTSDWSAFVMSQYWDAASTTFDPTNNVRIDTIHIPTSLFRSLFLEVFLR